MQLGGHLLLDWLVKAQSFTTSLKVLEVTVEGTMPQPGFDLIMQGLQSLLDNCSGHLKEWYFWAKIEVDDFKNIPLVSLAKNSSLTELYLRVSKNWFRYTLQQLQTIISKNLIIIDLWYWLDETERPDLELWKELDDILDADHFASLTKVCVVCAYRDQWSIWQDIEDFNSAEEFPKLLPKLYERGILIWC
ncbi:hypothetical protein QCA50_007455 [Cerrena zonata]|uniref:Uncharacterized protein n=1 Tax=Cerrena zonata TaxID=2478898 RepID=A0AAW0GEV5_9APHY